MSHQRIIDQGADRMNNTTTAERLAVLRAVYPGQTPRIEDVQRIAQVDEASARELIAALRGGGTAEVPPAAAGSARLVAELRTFAANVVRLADLMEADLMAPQVRTPRWSRAALANAAVLRLRYPHGLPKYNGTPSGSKVRQAMRWSNDKAAPAIRAYLAGADLEGATE